ncbi:hypothetical protein BGZ88_008823 [Linnemannia elongata]|uniref:Glucooligosaccharide oxidase n=1 Tax=Linnemannia elongata AG-77 TaxID=1314771 RepID=A0A197KJM0_9FUNG|nr:hypothetical protein BGZ88_008823 [Linnemannia elongata]KAK5828675.1 hypothetical protein F5H01DRAFT_328652 [Linnemannia elongata]OAQ36474.1 Glucooligosaccharide oxidase [Linnemannia elongata AG-77]
MHIPSTSSLLLLLVSLTLSSITPATEAAAPGPSADFLKCLKPLGSSKVLTAKDTAYQQQRYAFDLRYTYQPSVIIMAKSVGDVQTAVKCAAAAKIAVAPRSGGHSFEGYSIGGQDGSMVLDLTAMNSVKVKGDKATVGSGIRLGKLYLDLFNQGGWTINAGTCPSVGIGGHALGGGFGLLSRKYGLLADRIVEIEMVNAKGEVVKASASSNPDLFYSLRGAGGGSFGVVTSFTILPFKAATKATSFSYEWKIKDYAAVLKAYTNYQSKATREIGVEMNVGPSGLELYGIFQGSKADQAKALAPFLTAAPKPASNDVREGRQIDAQLRFAFVEGGKEGDINGLSLKSPFRAGDSHYTKGKSIVYPSALKDSTIALLGKWGAKKPSGATANYIIVDLWGGAVQDTAVDATSFIHRNAHTVFEFVVEWDQSAKPKPGKADCKDCLKWMNDMYAEFLADFKSAGYAGPLRGYQNYIDAEIPNWQDAYYGSAMTRLKKTKAAVDPTNVFRFPQSIPL